MAEHGHKPDPIEHVSDSSVWEFFTTTFQKAVEWELPAIPIPGTDHKFQITKFMLLELVAAALILAIFIPLARRARDGSLPKGKWWNAFESLLTFVRNEIARPNLGEHDADKYVPFLWSVFLFILFCNILGLLPFLGAPTASIAVTGGLALFSLLMIYGTAILKMGFAHYVKAQWPHIEVPYVGWFFSLFIFVLEQISTLIKCGVLAIRLFANIFAGHMVTVSILLFIYQVGVYTQVYLGQAGGGGAAFYSGVTLITVLGLAALSLLELFVCFLQAYVFTFLTAIFMGMSLHPEH